MITHAQPTSSSAAASMHGAASRSLELCEARQARDGLASLLRAERHAAADFLLALADFDHCRGWEVLGHASLFAFLNVELGLSKGGAFFRQTAARMLQRFPDLVEPLRDGRLCITIVFELSRVLTEANRAEVLPGFFGCSSQQAKELVAALVPASNPPVRAVVTLLEAPRMVEAVRPSVTPLPLPVVLETSHAGPATRAVQSTELAMTHPARVVNARDDVEPLTTDLRRLHVTVSRQFLEELELARDGLSHVIPNATTEQVLQAALRLLLEKQAKARGQVKRPRAVAPTETTTAAPSPVTSEPPPHRREGPREAIPAAVRRAVWERDGGRCSWPLDGGGCCGSTYRLELDHLVPWDLGGESSLTNLRLACAFHTRLAARQAFGKQCVDRYAGKRPG